MVVAMAAAGRECVAQPEAAGLRDLGPEDEFGLWSFPGNTTSEHTQLLPVEDWSPLVLMTLLALALAGAAALALRRRDLAT